jgi:hypothetical protein
MNKLITSDISAGARMPLKQGTLEFLQQAYQQPLNALAQRIIGTTYDPTKAYVLYGLTGSSGSITAGALFFNGEVYLCDGDSSGLPCGGSNVSVLNIAVSQYTTNADPVTFSDGAIYDVHDIRKVAITCGSSGSGDVCNYTDLVRLVTTGVILPADFETTWQGTPDVALTYRVTHDGLVQLRGRIQLNSTMVLTTPLGAGGLPTAITPTAGDLYILCTATNGTGIFDNGASAETTAMIKIRSTGSLDLISYPSGFGTSLDYLDLSGVSYKIS